MLKKGIALSNFEDYVIKTQKLFAELEPKIRNETIRAVTTIKIEEKLPKIRGSHFSNHGRLYAITDSKRQKILKEILELKDLTCMTKETKKFLRHMDAAVFKVIFSIIKEKLRLNKDIVSKYPEFFI